MRTEISMPKMGESLTEGTILKWHKKPGDFVKKDEILFEISTDKVDTEIPSPAEGIVSQILYPEGETVAVGTVVAVLGGEASAQSAAPAPAPVQESAPAPAAESKPAPAVTETAAEAPAPAADGDLVDVIMPKMGESIMEGTLISWKKKVGDRIKKEEIIFEISTDKVDTEVPSPAEGVLHSILVKEQETVAVGTVVARISGSGATASAPAAMAEPVKASAPAEVSMHDVIGKAASEAAPVEVFEKSDSDSSFYSPLVLNIAKTEGVSSSELASVTGTGIGGRVTKKDILAFVENRKQQRVIQPPVAAAPAPVAKPAPARPEPPKVDYVYTGDIERIPMDNIRQKIMSHMVGSRDTSVHVTGLLEVDMSKVHGFIQKNKDAFLQREGIKLTYMPFIAQAVVKALRENPLVNASIEGNTIVKKNYVNLGIAVALEPNGLIVPNIKNAQDKNITGLAKSINDLATRARTKKLTPDEIYGGTFTLTNYGVFGTLFGTPIINQPELAILGIGAVVKKPVVIEVDGMDTIAIKPMMYLTLSHDHRLIDGMLGGKFLKSVKDALEGFDTSAL
ncbi:MAG: 2-oxoglutarate dehydrogenase, E2 component, dihydrolipoamide succinyltransferase [Ignavibacteriaceae bacterium]|nr:2-oxoglutarate dehydrogenase, E2 component, dihydrolipoamide succinyltransferase [Ignavibacteriaceae bacterium]